MMYQVKEMKDGAAYNKTWAVVDRNGELFDIYNNHEMAQQIAKRLSVINEE